MLTKTFISLIVISIFFSIVFAQNTMQPEKHRLKKIKRTTQPDFKQTIKKKGHYTKADWQALIDERWGEGLPTEEKLAIFDKFWKRIDEDYACFPNSDVEWDALKEKYRPEVEAGVSRGRFNAIINHISLALFEAHTKAFEIAIHEDVLEPGVPLMVGYATYFNDHFGAALTPLPDSTLLVYKVVENHPLGLELGDRVLGYEGRQWKALYKELLSYELPMTSLFFGSTKDSHKHTWLSTAGENWHLFDTIDIIKYNASDTLHIPTSLLVDQNMELSGTEQMPVPGIPFPDFENGEAISWGIVEGTKIGYIYTYGWLADWKSDQFETAIMDLMYNHNTEGLILDTRFDWGGQPPFYTAGLKHLFNFNVYVLDAYERTDPENHFGFTKAHPNWPASYENLGFEATNDIYDKPIAILTGPASASGGDVFPLTARFHPYARTFGKATNGAFSGLDNSVENFALADGWYMLYSNHVISLADNQDYYLVRTAPGVDEEVWLEPDDVVNEEDTVVKRAIEWIQNLAYAHDVAVNKTFVKSGIDTIHITAQLENPNQHEVALKAEIKNMADVIIDSLNLYDDGLHEDGAANDSLWGCFYQPLELDEDSYTISMTTKKDSEEASFTLPDIVRFTTIGPIKLSDYEITKKLFFYSLNLTLKNEGTVAKAQNVTVELTPTAGQNFNLANPTQNGIGIDAGKTAEITESFTIFAADSINVIQLAARIFSNGHYFWTDTLDIDLTVVSIAERGTPPASFELFQNYPNPFNPSTTIEYSLPRPENVRITIYDILGQHIKTLVDTHQMAGEYHTSWNGMNDQNIPVTAGLYFYKMEAGDFVEVNKLMLLR